MVYREFVILLTIIWMVLIFLFSSEPATVSGEKSEAVYELLSGTVFSNIPVDTAIVIIRKSAHFLEYMILGILLTFSVRSICFSGSKKSIRSKRGYLSGALLPFLIGVLYAVSDEIHQYFVPGRACRFFDICIDASGVAVGVLLIGILHRARQERRK